MTEKFQVGDTVRLTGSDWAESDGFFAPPRGLEVEIVEIDEDGDPGFRWDNDTWWVYETEGGAFSAELVKSARTVVTGDLIVTEDNTVFEDLDIQGSVVVQARNVTIRNTLIRGAVTEA